MKTTKILLYCTKGKPYLYRTIYGKWGTTNQTTAGAKNGYILAECEVETEEIRLSAYSDYEDTIYLFDTPTLKNYELTQKSYLSDDELGDYLTNEKGYALHIKNLKIFDKCYTPFEFGLLTKSKEQMEYEKAYMFKYINKAPQNMMRAYKKGQTYVLISIRPEWLCKILNGEKTVEVRKKVLKEMLPDE